MIETSQYLKSLAIKSPTLLLDKKKVKRNIKKMTGKAEESGVQLRPHFKTHQSAEIGSWFKEFGITSITVSSSDMAIYFANYGWSDITIACLINILEIDKMNLLAAKIRLNILVDSEIAISSIRENLKHPVQVWLKIDAGYGRTGVVWDDWKQILHLVRLIQQSSNLSFAGLLTHSGHSYQAKSVAEIRDIHKQVQAKLAAIKGKLGDQLSRGFGISIGDTPSCSIVDDFSGLDEIRPGNFVFNDIMQHKLGVCSADEIAVAVACPVIGKYEDRRQVVVHGGAVHFSKEYILDQNKRKIFGYLASIENGSWNQVKHKSTMISLTQEHGIIEVDDLLFGQIEIGQLLLILPIHSCLTANLYQEYKTLDGEIISRL